MPDFADPKNVAALAALIAAVISLAGVVFTQWQTRRTQQELEQLKARLGEEKDERAARRDYEYEARKHLYAQCDPLLFQFVELSDNALGRITNLAKACQDHSVRADGAGWLDHPGYYFLTTMYRLLVPCVIFQLLQRRLTLLDLRLDSRIGTQFALCRTVYLSFRSDWDLAHTEPRLDYNPDHGDAGTLRVSKPAVYHRQGIYAGHLERAVEALIVAEAGQPSRFLRYGEFAAAYANTGSEVHQAFAPVADLFFGFHPATRPVLWRVLLVQTCLYRAVQLSKEFDTPYRDGRDAVRAALESATWLDWVPASEATRPRLDEKAADAARRWLESTAERMGATTS